MKPSLRTVILLGAAARLVALWLGPPLHPDAIFQYLEPAWHHLHGYGWLAWEWGVGLRSWVLPGYHGAWMAALDLLGVHGGFAAQIILQAHWGLLSLLIIPAAFRAGGPFAAVLCAFWPELVQLSPQTLTEVPSAIAITLGYAAWLQARTLEGAEERRAALVAGALLSFACCLRIPNGPLALVPAVDFLVRRRKAALGALALASLGPLLFFGAVDWITWGRPFHSMAAFLNYNFLQGRAAEHGVSPWYDYSLQLLFLTSGTIVIVIAAAALDWRRTWMTAGPSLLLVVLLSTQRHKEERFILACWPLLAIAWGVAMQRRTTLVAWLSTALVLLGTLYGVAHRPLLDYARRTGLYEAEAWVGQQPDVTGLLVFEWIHLSGGFLDFSRNLPLEPFGPQLLANPIFNYAAVKENSREADLCSRAGFVRVQGRREWAVWRRASR